jgi:serine phosphatase RsbU (regulator of sigma subunit)/tetratricopeptide (TPR) repeat protein
MSLLSQLNTLESAGLVRLAQFEPELEYLFRHALVQEAAYATLLSDDRRRLHQAVGLAVERLYASHLDEQAATLAHHFELAGDPVRARNYYGRAGKNALSSFANQEAAQHLQKALSYSTAPDQEAELFALLGEALARQSHYQEAIDTWRKSIQIYRAQGKLDKAAYYYARMARTAWYMDKTKLGLEIGLEGEKATLGAPEGKGVAALIHEIGRAYHFNGISDKARGYCQRALEMAQKFNAVDVQADTLTTIGVLSDQPIQEALDALDQAVNLAENCGLLQIAQRAHHNYGVMLIEALEDPQNARRHYQRSAEIAHLRGTVSDEINARLNIFSLDLNQGNLTQTRQELAEIEKMARSVPQGVFTLIETRFMYAILDWFEDKPSSAKAQLYALADETRQSGNLQFLTNILAEYAGLELEMLRWGEEVDSPQLEKTVQELRNLYEQGLSKPGAALTETISYAARRGDLETARHFMAELENIAKSTKYAWHEYNLNLARAEIADAEGRLDDLVRELENAVGFFSRAKRQLNVGIMMLHWSAALMRRGTPADLEKAIAVARDAQVMMGNMGIRYYERIATDLLEKLRSKRFALALDHESVMLEMHAAARFQEGLLPRNIPQLPGWELAAALDPARQTSGDFYDFLTLPGGLGLVIADVADKGASAALFMSMARSLLRTFAAEHPFQPDLVLQAVNQRLLADASQSLFVTGFYGLLDTTTGNLVYVNAGHNPPYLRRAQNPQALEQLPRTGVPLGVLEDSTWEVRSLDLEPDDLLVLYTDGVTEAQDEQGQFYGEERFEETLLRLGALPAEEVVPGIMATLSQFVGRAPQADDITLVALRRAGG